MRVLLLAGLLAAFFCVPALAITESEVEAQVAASGKESVTGNVLIWFLCAIAFLKVSQKIDSILASLGVNIGQTGGSLLADAMLAVRSVTMVSGAAGRSAGGRRAGNAGSASSGGSSSAGNSSWFLKGGLAGVVSRKVTNSAARTATTQTSAVHTAQRQSASSTVHSTAATHTGSEVHTGSSTHTGNSTHTENSAQPNINTQIGRMPVDGSGPAAVPPNQAGVIVAGENRAPGTAQTNTVTSSTDACVSQANTVIPTGGAVISDGSAPSGAPPADAAPVPEGVILTGSEAPIHVPGHTAPIDTPATYTQPVSTQPTVPGGDAPQENGIIPGGDSRSQVYQSEVSHTEASRFEASEAEVYRATQSTARQSDATHTSSETQTVKEVHTSEKVRTAEQSGRAPASDSARPTLGGMIFSKSLASGGSFANDVIGTVARGEVPGSITGDMAVQSLHSYMGHTALGNGAGDIPAYTNAEIGNGRITGMETAPNGKEALAFAMYHVEKYAAPDGKYNKVVTADGTPWYKQYATDAVEKTPFIAPDGEVDYHKKIVKKLPDAPKRKDRM